MSFRIAPGALTKGGGGGRCNRGRGGVWRTLCEHNQRVFVASAGQRRGVTVTRCGTSHIPYTTKSLCCKVLAAVGIARAYDQIVSDSRPINTEQHAFFSAAPSCLCPSVFRMSYVSSVIGSKQAIIEKHIFPTGHFVRDSTMRWYQKRGTARSHEIK